MQLLLVPLVNLPEIVTDQRHVEQQLHVMLLFLFRFDIVIIRELPLPGLLLDQDPEVQLQIIHTSLEAQQLREERRFDHRRFQVEMLHVVRQFRIDRLGDILLLLLRFAMEACVNPPSQQTQCVILIEISYALGVGSCVRQLMDRLV